MSKSYVDDRLAELGLKRRERKAEVKARAYQLRRRENALQGAPVPQDHCDCCGRNPRESRRGNQSLCLDHDHVTGAFRGWLCHACNLGIGLLGDNADSLRRALAYLERPVKSPAAPNSRLAGILDSVKKLDPK